MADKVKYEVKWCIALGTQFSLQISICVPKMAVASYLGLKNWLGSTHPPMQWVLGAISPGVKRPGREANHSPPTSAEVKNTWFYISTPP
jgi:hypothetical protein